MSEKETRKKSSEIFVFDFQLISSLYVSSTNEKICLNNLYICTVVIFMMSIKRHLGDVIKSTVSKFLFIHINEQI